MQDAAKNDYQGVQYVVSAKLLNAADYGVPQLRERVVIVGIRRDLQKDWLWPASSHSMERLLWDQHVTGEYWERNNVARSERQKILQSLPSVRRQRGSEAGLFAPEQSPWITIRDALSAVGEPDDTAYNGEHRFRGGARSYPGHTGSPIDWPSKTIKAGGHGVPGGENTIICGDGTLRYLTVFEAKLLQSFEPSFEITGSWGEAMRQIGNAVPPRLARVLGDQLVNVLHSRERLLQVR